MTSSSLFPRYRYSSFFRFCILEGIERILLPDACKKFRFSNIVMLSRSVIWLLEMSSFCRFGRDCFKARNAFFGMFVIWFVFKFRVLRVFGSESSRPISVSESLIWFFDRSRVSSFLNFERFSGIEARYLFDRSRLLEWWNVSKFEVDRS